MALTFIDEYNFTNKNIIVRFDFNVPLDKKDPSKILDTTRIDAAIPTIKYLLENGAKQLILMSHLGRPKGKVVDKYSLEPVALYLANILSQEVLLTESALDKGIKTLLKINSNKIIMLQNLRFHPEEELNDLDFAKSLSEYADVYVNDAFGTAHRRHASTHGIISFFQNNSLAGFLIRNELKALTRIINTPTKPFIGIVGGAKVSDKIKIIEKLLPQVDQLIIGGAMAYPFLKAKGIQIGKSLCDEEDTKLAANILNLPTSQKIVLPIDHVVSKSLGGDSMTINTSDIPDELIGLDIGNLTIKRFKSTLDTAKTIFWNGPMGMFENPQFNNGTLSIAKIISQLGHAYTLVGGGDSVNAVKQSNLTESFSHISTGGGASLEYIEEGTLVGIQALTYGVN